MPQLRSQGSGSVHIDRDSFHCDEKFSEYEMEKMGYADTEPQCQSQELRNRHCC